VNLMCIVWQVFGGVHDELDEEHMESVFYPDLFIFSPATSSWYLYVFK